MLIPTRSENRVRVRGRVHAGFLPERRLADDGERCYSGGRRVSTRSENRVRVRGRVHAGFFPGPEVGGFLFLICSVSLFAFVFKGLPERDVSVFHRFGGLGGSHIGGFSLKTEEFLA